MIKLFVLFFLVCVSIQVVYGEHDYTSTEGYTLTVTSQTNFEAGQLLNLNLVIRTEDGSHLPSDNVQLYHDRLFHAIIISHDLDLMFHVHPEDFGNITLMNEHESYNVSVLLPRAGLYIFGVDFIHDVNATYSQPVTLFASVTATGTPAQNTPTWDDLDVRMKKFKSYPFIGPDRYDSHIDFTDNADPNGYKIHLVVNHGEQPLTLQCNDLHFHVYNDAGENATNLQPYLNAAAHIAAVHEDRHTSYYFHLHGSAHMGSHSMMGMKRHIDDPAANHFECGGHANHTMLPATFGPAVAGSFHFPFTGKWDIIVQIKYDDGSQYGQLIVGQFAVEIAPQPTTEATSSTTSDDVSETSEASGFLLATILVLFLVL